MYTPFPTIVDTCVQYYFEIKAAELYKTAEFSLNGESTEA